MEKRAASGTWKKAGSVAEEHAREIAELESLAFRAFFAKHKR
jgi:hypothetical protein